MIFGSFLWRFYCHDELCPYCISTKANFKNGRIKEGIFTQGCKTRSPTYCSMPCSLLKQQHLLIYCLLSLCLLFSLLDMCLCLICWCFPGPTTRMFHAYKSNDSSFSCPPEKVVCKSEPCLQGLIVTDHGFPPTFPHESCLLSIPSMDNISVFFRWRR